MPASTCRTRPETTIGGPTLPSATSSRGTTATASASWAPTARRNVVEGNYIGIGRRRRDLDWAISAPGCRSARRATRSGPERDRRQRLQCDRHRASSGTRNRVTAERDPRATSASASISGDDGVTLNDLRRRPTRTPVRTACRTSPPRDVATSARTDHDLRDDDEYARLASTRSSSSRRRRVTGAATARATALGSTTMTTNPTGGGRGRRTVAWVSTWPGDVVVATATDALHNTSEFSAGLAVTRPDETEFTVNSSGDTSDGTCNAAHCTLREAINAANADSGCRDDPLLDRHRPRHDRADLGAAGRHAAGRPRRDDAARLQRRSADPARRRRRRRDHARDRDPGRRHDRPRVLDHELHLGRREDDRTGTATPSRTTGWASA